MPPQAAHGMWLPTSTMGQEFLRLPETGGQGMIVNDEEVTNMSEDVGNMRIICLGLAVSTPAHSNRVQLYFTHAFPARVCAMQPFRCP